VTDPVWGGVDDWNPLFLWTIGPFPIIHAC